MRETDDNLLKAKALLSRAVAGLAGRAQAELAVELGHALLSASQASTTSVEKAQARRLGALMDDKNGQAFATAITDRVHRSKSGAELVRQVRSLVLEFGIPRSLRRVDRLELRALSAFGSSLPELTAAAVRRRIYHDASPYIVPADVDALHKYLRRMQRDNVRVNINHLGEEVLGEREAERHLGAYLSLIERSEVSTISVKISSLYSQLNPLAWDKCLALLGERLELIYRKAVLSSPPKLVYLDMESYRDLAMTVELFMRLLERSEFSQLTAGIVLQAYLPDSVAYQRRLTEFAMTRLRLGGAPIRLRLVKGANLAMERLEASHRGWPLATYATKHEVDANYKRMLKYACQPEHARAVEIGVASHNLFDLALALVMRKCSGVEARVELEMLEGMAEPLRRSILSVAGSVLVYAPSVDEKNFPAAVAYLVRRLDENTAEDNFLRHSFNMRPGDDSFQAQAQAFLRAFEATDEVSSEPKRGAVSASSERAPHRAVFENEPDTDFTDVSRRMLLEAQLRRTHDQEFLVALEVGGKRWLEGPLSDGFDPSRPGHVPYRHAEATPALLDTAIECARGAFHAWARLPVAERAQVLLRAAAELRAARNELILHLLLDAGKRVEEGDAEVSEAIDFAEYYARQFTRLSELYVTEPKGVVVVTPPWNFPLAIPVSGVSAALVAGNSVVLKAAPETVLVAATLVRLFHQAGVPKELLQLVAAKDAVASQLIQDERVNTVVLTGATATAQLFYRLRPGLDLLAETGGKNAIYVSDLCDREQACRHVVRSAFGHSGQKCSALSLLVVHQDVYHDEGFKGALLDATESLPVGSAWDLGNVVTPLIREPSGALARAIAELEPGEQWLLEAKRHAHNPRLVSPGIKWQTRAGSFTHMTEFFGPILGALPAPNLKQALRLINQTPYGLTSGIESLNPAECQAFADGVEAGNVYTNSPITGAIVGRQPFGGRKASGFGPGAKAGGPNYVAQFCRTLERKRRVQAPALSRGPRNSQPASLVRDDLSAPELSSHFSNLDLPESERSLLAARMADYEQAYQLEFARSHPQAEVLGMTCILRYQPCRVLLYLSKAGDALDAYSCLYAALRSGAVLTVASCGELDVSALCRATGVLLSAQRSIGALRDLIVKQKIERVRVVGQLPPEISVLPQELAISVFGGRGSQDGYSELCKYMSEQVVSTSYHRYGNLVQPRGPRRAGNSPR